MISMYTMKEKLILASASPRRVEMLTACGVTFTKHPSDIEEIVLPNETPKAMVERLSVEKGKSVALVYPNDWVLSADTTVAIGDEILNKPIDTDDSVRMLSMLAGNTHTVWGGVSLQNHSKGVLVTATFASEVKIRALTRFEIDQYIKTGEPSDKAGSYAIQGIGASLVESVKGSYTNVVGLNLSETILLLLQNGVIFVE